MPNIFHLEADYKIDKKVREPIITQNDDVLFNIAIFDNTLPVDLAAITAVTLAHERPDGVTVVTPGSVLGENVAAFPVRGNPFEVIGIVQATAQFFVGESRVSTLRFPYRVVKDPTGSGYIPPQEDLTLIQIVLGDGARIIREAGEALESLEGVLDGAQQAAQAATSAAQAATLAAGNAGTATTNANNASQAANNAASSANNAAGAAQAATTAANNAAAAANAVAGNVAGWNTATPWSASVTYARNNFATRNGETWQAKRPNTNVVPVEGADWTLIAARGVDGMGSVSKVNGMSPDNTGNVTLPKATTTSVTAGVDNIDYMTPARTVEAIGIHARDSLYNLYTGSRNFSGSAWVNLNLWGNAADGEGYKDFRTIYKTTAFSGVGQNIIVEAGKTYTFSAYVRTTGNLQYQLWLPTTEAAVGGATLATISLTSRVSQPHDEWRLVGITFTVSVTGYIRPRVEPTATGTGRVYVAGQAVYEGRHIREWVAAYEDVIPLLATQQQAEQGTDNTTQMTPLRVGQATAQRLREYDQKLPYNLLTGSYDFSRGAWNNIEQWTRVAAEDSYLGHPTFSRAGNWLGIGQSANLAVGTYTLCVIYRTEPGVLPHLFVAAAGGGQLNNTVEGSKFLDESATWAIGFYTFNVTTAGRFNGRIEKRNVSTNATGRVFFSLLALFEGNYAKPWVPGLLDTMTPKATNDEVSAGTRNDVFVTPSSLLRVRKAVRDTTVTDLNTLTRLGQTFISGSIAAGVANKPPTFTNLGFFLENFDSEGASSPTQMAWDLLGRVAFRANNNGTWQPWRDMTLAPATLSEAQAGTNTTALMTPALVRAAIEVLGDARFVNTTGDTMSGDLGISKAVGRVVFNVPGTNYSFEVLHNANASTDAGIILRKNGQDFLRVYGQTNVQIYHITHGWMSIVEHIDRLDNKFTAQATVPTAAIPNGRFVGVYV